MRFSCQGEVFNIVEDIFAIHIESIISKIIANPKLNIINNACSSIDLMSQKRKRKKPFQNVTCETTQLPNIHKQTHVQYELHDSAEPEKKS